MLSQQSSCDDLPGLNDRQEMSDALLLVQCLPFLQQPEKFDIFDW